MNNNQVKIDQLSYLSGKQFYKKVMDALNVETQQGVADALGINKSTIATQVQRDLTPYELAIRIHLRTGISLRWLLLDEGAKYSAGNPYTIEESKQIYSYADKRLQPKDLFDVDTFDLNGSKLNLLGTTTIDQRLLDDFGVQNVLAIKEPNALHIVDKEIHSIISGSYVIEIAGLYSLNKVQRVAGNNLAVTFGEDVIEFPSNEIRVLGKVVMEIKKK